MLSMQFSRKNHNLKVHILSTDRSSFLLLDLAVWQTFFAGVPLREPQHSRGGAAGNRCSATFQGLETPSRVVMVMVVMMMLSLLLLLMMMMMMICFMMVMVVVMMMMMMMMRRRSRSRRIRAGKIMAMKI